MKAYLIELLDSLKSIGGIILAASFVGTFISGDFTKPYALFVGILLGGVIQQAGIIGLAMLSSKDNGKES